MECALASLAHAGGGRTRFAGAVALVGWVLGFIGAALASLVRLLSGLGAGVYWGRTRFAGAVAVSWFWPLGWFFQWVILARIAGIGSSRNGSCRSSGAGLRAMLAVVANIPRSAGHLGLPIAAALAFDP